MIEEIADLRCAQRPREPLHVVLHEHLHRGALIERPRSIAICTPPAMDMWAPRRIADCGLWIAERGARRSFSLSLSASSFRNPQSPVRNCLESLRVPIRFLQTSFAGVFKKFVDRREQDSRRRWHLRADRNPACRRENGYRHGRPC